jgi:hypothetical protein
VPAVVVEQGRSKLRAGAAFMAAAFAQDDARTTKTNGARLPPSYAKSDNYLVDVPNKLGLHNV